MILPIKHLNKLLSLGQYTIEQQFKVHAALLIVLIGEDDTVARYRGLHEERSVGRFRDGLLGEEQAAADLGMRGVEQHTGAVDNDNMIEQAIDVSHLMGRDDDGLVIAHVARNEAAKLALRGDVESVGRLVHHKE